METSNSSAVMPVSSQSVPEGFNNSISFTHPAGTSEIRLPSNLYSDGNGTFYNSDTGLKFRNVSQGSTYRGLGSSIFNKANIERENAKRAENAAFNAYQRDLKLMQEQYALSRELRSTVVEDLQKQGLNPVLAYQSLGSSTMPSPSRSSGSHYNQSTGDSDSLLAILQLVASLFSGKFGGSVNPIGFGK
ncbi:DNA pilot protein [Dipodfec virus UOA04_Rod_715]|nr:DNA pilot protein [Dipodfec virus UOA04_Rod_715]